MNFLLPPLSRGGAGARAPGSSGRPGRPPWRPRAPTCSPPSSATTGTRRYFLAFQNNAELRGTGGFIGNWGEIVGEGGRLRLERFGRLRGAERRRDPPPDGHRVRRRSSSAGRMFNPGQIWQQVNVSPDFPTTARLIGELYPQSGGEPVDGVIAVDPPGLAAMLKLTGPVAVPGWPVPITADNVVDVTLREAYEAFPQDERVAFLGDLARQGGGGLHPGRPGPAGRGRRPPWARPPATGHLLVWMADPRSRS